MDGFVGRELSVPKGKSDTVEEGAGPPGTEVQLLSCPPHCSILCLHFLLSQSLFCSHDFLSQSGECFLFYSHHYFHCVSTRVGNIPQVSGPFLPLRGIKGITENRIQITPKSNHRIALYMYNTIITAMHWTTWACTSSQKILNPQQ